MVEKLSPEEQKRLLIVLSIIFGPFILTAILINIARQWFPIFLVLATILIPITLILFLIGLLKWDDYFLWKIILG